MPAQRRIPLVLPVPCDVLRTISEERRTRAPDDWECDVLRARLATRQEGVVGYDQLVALGYTRHQIAHAVTTRRLIRRHKGVFALGHEALSDRGRIIAALLAVGPDAAASHETAAYVYSLIPSMPPFVHVTVRGRRPRSRHGIRVHHATELATTVHHGLPITTPLQTLAQLREPTRSRARDEALLLGLIDRAHDDHAEPTRSELERVLLPALERAGLPKPIVNGHVLGHEVDFHWPEHRVVVETDGWSTHGRRRAFESDRDRDAGLQAAGWSVLRFTWRQVTRATLKVVVRIGQTLAIRSTEHGRSVDLCDSAHKVTAGTGPLDR